MWVNPAGQTQTPLQTCSDPECHIVCLCSLEGPYENEFKNRFIFPNEQ